MAVRPDRSTFRAGNGRPPAVGMLNPRELAAVRELVERVRVEVPATLVQASLFGSKAREEARPDSDVDILLVFERLPADREPHASYAEEIAGGVSAVRRVPVTVWSVSLPDLRRGWRTPMLVDALADAVPIWTRVAPLPAVPFTPADALFCVDRLLDRVDEGGDEVLRFRRGGERKAAIRRARDDIIRLCTALLLLHGVTRPRRAAAVRAGRRIDPVLDRAPAPLSRVLDWTADSFGRDGRDGELPLDDPPGGLLAACRAIDDLQRRVIAREDRLRRRFSEGTPLAPSDLDPLFRGG